MKQLFPGLMISALIGGIAKVVAIWATALGDVSIAIVLGIVVANFRKLPEPFIPGVRFSEKTILSLAIMLMGFGLNWEKLSGAGWLSLSFLLIVVASTVLISYVMGMLMGVKPSLSLLIGMGNAICGASAVAASAPILTKDKEEIGIAVSVVNLLGTLGIFALPGIIAALRYDDHHASILVGGSLQAVGHVVAAGYAVSPEVGELSLAIKMGRIFLLAPALIVLALINPTAGPQEGSQKTGSWFRKLPPYLYGFVICAVIGNINLLPVSVFGQLKFVSHHLLLLAMAAVGLQIRFSTLVRQGPVALALGSGTFLIQVMLLAALLFLI